jgi:dual specificity tyrosine-phosphorylation-regulated kinase 2/3/4
MSALEPATAQRVARLKTSSSALTATAPITTRTTSSSSRLTSQTVSSMQKQSDASLRSRNQLPTIAGSPSVGTNSSHTSKEAKEPPPSSLMNSMSGSLKETPTKIPRISSRTSAGASPPLKNSVSNVTNRRVSVNISGLAASTNPSPTELSTNEFGVMENGDGQMAKTISGTTRQSSVRASPSTNSTSRVPRQVSAATSGSIVPRKGIRDSVSFTGIRKSSTGSVASVSSSAAPTESHHRFSALSPSKGLKLLSPKLSLPAARVSNSVATQNIHQAIGSPSSSRQSLSTPSPAPSSVDEEELLGDEEMLHYIRRQQAKKMATGATQEELDELLRFPEPLPPGTPSSPSG